MNESKAQERIHEAVRDSLSWLDRLPSQETEILEQTKKEADPLITVINGNTETMIPPAFTPARHHTSAWFRPVLAVAAVLVLITGFWAAQRHGFVGSITPDVVTQPAGSEETPGLPAAVITDKATQPETLPLDRIDLYVEPDLLWNSETGILTEGENVDKKNLPFKNTVYRKMKDAGVKVDGELVYRSDEGAVLFKDQVKLCLDGDFALDMPQKGFLIDAADGSFDFPLFDDREASSYPTLLLRNSGNDSMITLAKMCSHIFGSIAFFRVTFRPDRTQFKLGRKLCRFYSKITVFSFYRINRNTGNEISKDTMYRGIRVPPYRRGKVAVILERQTKMSERTAVISCLRH